MVARFYHESDNKGEKTGIFGSANRSWDALEPQFCQPDGRRKWRRGNRGWVGDHAWGRGILDAGDRGCGRGRQYWSHNRCARRLQLPRGLLLVAGGIVKKRHSARARHLAFCVVLLAAGFLRDMYQPELLESPWLRGAFLACWAVWPLALLGAGRAETEPEWRRYDRGAAIFAMVVLGFDLAWPDGWGHLRPGRVASSVGIGLLGPVLWTKPTRRSGADEERDAPA